MSAGEGALGLPGIPASAPRKRGRPPGSKGKRSGQLGQYIEAVYGGLTPGQQAAAVGLVTAKEVKAAGGDVILAMAAKAKALGKELGIDPDEAWRLMAAERQALMPYVHQKLAQLDVTSAGKAIAGPTLIVADVNVSAPELLMGEDEENQDLIEGHAVEVSRLKSHVLGEP